LTVKGNRGTKDTNQSEAQPATSGNYQKEKNLELAGKAQKVQYKKGKP